MGAANSQLAPRRSPTHNPSRGPVSPPSRVARLARGWIAAGITTGLAAASHIIAGAAHPPLLLVLFSFAFSGLVCVPLAGRTLSWVRMLTAVVLSQGFFHFLFALAGHQGHAGHLNLSAHTHHAQALTVVSQPTLPDLGAHQLSAPMALSHLAAALLTVAVLRRGELVALALLSVLALRLHALLSLFQPITVQTRSPKLSTVEQIWPRLKVFVRLQPYRGPPAFCGAL